MRSILIINLGGIGDALLSTPALRALRNFYPEAEISMLISPKTYQITTGLSYIDRAYIFQVGYGGIIPLGKMFNNFFILFKLRRMRFDLSVNMRTLVSQSSAKKIKFMLSIINPAKKAGRDTEGRGYFFDIKIPETDIGSKYEMEYDIDMVNALGGKVIDRNIYLQVNEENLEKVELILAEGGVANDSLLIGLHPGGMPSRRWPEENFLQVIEEIGKKVSCYFVITGGKDEINLAGKIMSLAAKNIKIINLAGKLDFRQLCALIKRCDVFVSNDTGPMHIAAILKTPLVAIFGPGDITRFDPRNIYESAIVLYKKVECAPCNRIGCKSIECLRLILPEEVIKAALSLLKESKKREK